MRKPPLVLAYHGIGDVPRELDPHNLFVRAERFADQVRRLQRRGYAFVPLTQLAHALTKGDRVTGVCALTFDDGSVDNADVLPDLLETLGVNATVFVCPGLLGQPHPFVDPRSRIRLMTAEEVQRISRLPFIDIGSHTNAHTSLATADEETALQELVSSKQALERLLGRPVPAFAYPACTYSPSCPRAARRAGYEVAVTCSGLGSLDVFELRRESVDSLDGTVTFALKSRRLWHPLRRSRAGVLARRLARRRRHPQHLSP